MNSMAIGTIAFACVFGGAMLGMFLRFVLPEWPFLALLVFWLTILFVGFGLSAPRNATVIAVFLLCSLSIADAIYLILGMDLPYHTPMKISSAPLRTAIDQLGR